MSAWIAYINFLEHFVHLKVLHIQYNISRDSTYPLTNAIPLLRPLPAPRKLRELVFQTSVWECEVTTEDFDWLRDLDAELEHEHFRNLTKVVFDFDINLRFTSEEQILELIEGNLPKLSSRRPPILHIDVTVFVYLEDEESSDASIWSDVSSESEGASQTSDETSD